MKILILSALAWLSILCCPVTAQTDFRTLTLNHQIAVGMTYADVIASWGNPQNRGYIVTRNGTQQVMTENWSMPNGWMVAFENGRVIYFSQIDATGQ
jgi:hypothetical protein